MSQVAPQFDPLPEYTELAKALIAKWPDRFYGINADTIKAVVITNKSRSEKKETLYDVLPVKQPIRLDCSFAYYVIFFLDDWDGLDRKHKLVQVARSLHAIPATEEEEGKVLAPDHRDYAIMLRTLGVDYETRDDIPDLLNDDIKWVVI